MARLLVHVEGETEETFVNRLLSAHLYGCGYSFIVREGVVFADGRLRFGTLSAT